MNKYTHNINAIYKIKGVGWNGVNWFNLKGSNLVTWEAMP
jgi:hypothetical protein